MRPDFKIGLALGLFLVVGLTVYLILSWNSDGKTGQVGSASQPRRPVDDRNADVRTARDNRTTRIETPVTQTPKTQTPPPKNTVVDASDKSSGESWSGLPGLTSPAKSTGGDQPKADENKSSADKFVSSETIKVKIDPTKSDASKATAVAVKEPAAPKVQIPFVDMTKEENRGNPKLAGTPVYTPGYETPLPEIASATPVAKGAAVVIPKVDLSKSSAADSSSEIGVGNSTTPVGSGRTTQTPAGGLSNVTQAPPASAATYTVKEGDSLWAIAESVYGKGNGGKYDLILAANPGIDPSNLRAGKVLKVPSLPAGKGTGSTAATDVVISTATVTPSGSKTYVVAAGDNGLAVISKKVYGSSKHWTLIQQANQSVDTTRLKVGTVLVIPPLPAEKASATPTIGGTPAVTGGTSPLADTYTVKAGDNGFGAIARKVYGNEKYWTVIKDANPDVESTSLQVGQVLKTPKLPGSTSASPAKSAGDAVIKDAQPRFVN